MTTTAKEPESPETAKELLEQVRHKPNFVSQIKSLLAA